MAPQVSVSFHVPIPLLPKLAHSWAAPIVEGRALTIRWDGQVLQVNPNGSVFFQGDEGGRFRLREELGKLFGGLGPLIGTDEVGISHPVGPMVVAGVALDASVIPDLILSGVRDSKRVENQEVPRLKEAVM